LSGSVAYVAQCLPVEARIYDPVNCTQEIPAEIGSEEFGNVTRKYANAQTMILQDFRTRVPCTKEYPPKWKIEDRWYCSYPVVQECNNAPTQLNLTYDHTFRSMRAIFDGIKGGSSTAPRFKGVDCGNSWPNARRPLRMRRRTRPCTTPRIKRLWENP
jgi:hypothetical protein